MRTSARTKAESAYLARKSGRKLVYVALRNAVPQWMRARSWTAALIAFKIHVRDRIPHTASGLSPIDTHAVTVTLHQPTRLHS